MEASTFTTPAFMTTLTQESSSTTPEPATIKMEELLKPQLPMTPSDEAKASSAVPETPADASTPAPSTTSDGKQVKKRKSWGQVLPEPKTNLPPRKRAKTDDEKEQRRIERVKRNRLAAHNSRERKRQEVETLQQDKQDLEDRVRQLEAALQVYRQHLPDLKVDVFDFQPSSSSAIAPTTPAPTETISDTINPRTASITSMTPQTSPSLGSIDSPPFSDSQPATPLAFPETTVADHEQTQHSAAMLCDLQCQSCISNRQSSMESAMAFQAVITSLIMFNLQIYMTQLLTTTCSIFHRSMINQFLSSMIKTSSTPKASSSHSSQTSVAWTFQTILEQILICSPPQAQHLVLATRLASLSESSSKIGGRSTVTRASWLDRDARRTYRALRRQHLTSTRANKPDSHYSSSEAAAMRANTILTTS